MCAIGMGKHLCVSTYLLSFMASIVLCVNFLFPLGVCRCAQSVSVMRFMTNKINDVICHEYTIFLYLCHNVLYQAFVFADL